MSSQESRPGWETSRASELQNSGDTSIRAAIHPVLEAGLGFQVLAISAGADGAGSDNLQTGTFTNACCPANIGNSAYGGRARRGPCDSLERSAAGLTPTGGGTR